MAREVITSVFLIDDISGEKVPDDQGRTVRFSFENSYYEIDLTHYNAEQFEKHLQQYVEAARRVANPLRAAQRNVPKKLLEGGEVKMRDTSFREKGHPKYYRTHAARAWAKQNGFPDVPKAGRLPQEVIAAYFAAFPDMLRK